MSDQEEHSHVLPELVEPLNEYFHVPAASVMVPPLVKTPITPNQVTYISVLCGLGAAYAFSTGQSTNMIIGGLLLEASLILDCVDGQLARAKNMASDWGRLVDGIGGYVSNLAVVLGIGLGFPGNTAVLIWITVLTILRAVSYDYCKQYMTSQVHEGIDGIRQEVLNTLQKYKTEPSFILKVYFYYLQLQQLLFNGRFQSFAKSLKQEGTANFKPLSLEDRKLFYSSNRKLLLIWRWNGPDLVFFLLVLAALFQSMNSWLMGIAVLVSAQLVLMFLFHHILIRHETHS